MQNILVTLLPDDAINMICNSSATNLQLYVAKMLQQPFFGKIKLTGSPFPPGRLGVEDERRQEEHRGQRFGPTYDAGYL